MRDGIIEQPLDGNKPYLKDIINNQLTIVINFISSKDIDKECLMHSKSDNIETMIYDKVDEVIQELFESLLPSGSYVVSGLDRKLKSNNKSYQ